MPFEKVQSDSLEESMTRFITLSPQEIMNHASKLNSQELLCTITLLGEANDNQKCRALIQGLNHRQSIEQAGQALNAKQILDLLDHREILETKDLWKISPLLVGMRPSVFREILSLADLTELQVLKQEGITEPVQHQITILTQDLLEEIDHLFRQTFYLEMEINALDSLTTSEEEINQAYKKIDTAVEKAESLLTTLNALLELTWNTSRIDLIEKLTYNKTSLQKILNQLGHPGDHQLAPQGLYAKLKYHFESAFQTTPPFSSIESWDDDTPILEALTQFSMWYLQDYWQLGLLPEITERSELNLDPEIYTEQECLAHREYLINLISHNLEKYHLKTVHDLKKNQIFSKKALYDYLKKTKTLV